jgi:alkylation response protein AidB-like acyl-CoA dehydrogenase
MSAPYNVSRRMILELTPEQDAFRADVETFARERVAPRAADVDATNRFPADLIRELAARGLLGITIPREHGGLGLDHVSCVLAIEAIARASATVAVIAAVNNSLVAEVIARFGSPAQHAMWLRRLATGDAVGTFALSEENAGTDAANQRTTAVRDGGGFRISGRKVWAANAEGASVAIVFAATRPGDRGRGITAFLLPLDRPGLSLLPGADSLGVRGLGCRDILLDDVRAGEDEVLGPLDHGFGVARWGLEAGRISIAGLALGVGAAALDAAIAHAKQRQTFGRPIAKYQAIQWFLADIATELEAARMLTLKAAASRSAGRMGNGEAEMAKLAASEAAHRAADRAMQVLASAGYRRGSVVERLFRDARASEIYQGTSEVQRMIIAAAVMRED